MRKPGTYGFGSMLGWGLASLLTVIVWYWGAVSKALPFWQIEGDYSWLALSHAFTLESKAAGVPATNFAYNVHPGVPFGFVSWIAFRLSTFAATGHAGRISHALANVGDFWSFAKGIGLLLNLSGLWVMRYIFRDAPRMYLLAATTYLAALPAVWNAALFQLSNESLALLYLMSFYSLALAALSPGFCGRREGVFFVLGALMAVGWSIKIYYLAPSIGFVFGALTAAYLNVFPRKALFRLSAWFAAGIAVAMLVLIYGFLGWPVIVEWVQWNWKMLSHTGRYGTADQGLLAQQAVVGALKTLTVSTRGTFPTLVGLVGALAALTVFKNRRDCSWVRDYLPFAITASVGTGINLLALLKHYAPHYGICVVASLACLLFVISVDRTGGRMVGLLYLAVPVCLVVTLNTAASTHTAQLQKSEAVLRDIAAISKLPIEPGQRRIWAYFSPSRDGVVPLVANYCGSAFAARIVNESANKMDSSPAADPDAKDWRYVILPKTYYPTPASVATNYPKMFDFKGTAFTFSGTERMTELEKFIVVERDLR